MEDRGSVPIMKEPIYEWFLYNLTILISLAIIQELMYEQMCLEPLNVSCNLRTSVDPEDFDETPPWIETYLNSWKYLKSMQNVESHFDGV